MAGLVDDLATEIWVPEKRRRVETRESGGHRNQSGQIIPRDIEDLEKRLIQRRKASIETIPLEAERNEAVQRGEPRRERTSEVIIGKIKSLKTVKSENGGRKSSDEGVAAEEERFKIEESGKIRNGSLERVIV